MNVQGFGTDLWGGSSTTACQAREQSPGGVLVHIQVPVRARLPARQTRAIQRAVLCSGRWLRLWGVYGNLQSFGWTQSAKKSGGNNINFCVGSRG